jgi:hypothetical protein
LDQTISDNKKLLTTPTTLLFGWQVVKLITLNGLHFINTECFRENRLPGSSILALTTGVGPLTTSSQYPAASKMGTARTAAKVTMFPEKGEITFITRRVNDGSKSGDEKKKKKKFD